MCSNAVLYSATSAAVAGSLRTTLKSRNLGLGLRSDFYDKADMCCSPGTIAF